MSKTNFLYPIDIEGPYIIESNLWVNSIGPDGDTRCSVDIDCDRRELIEEENSYVMPMKMRVDVELNDADEAAANRMRASMTVTGSLLMSKLVEASPSEVEDNLRLNATSMFYSFVKAQIESQTAMSPMRRFTIPAISPQRVVDLMSEELK